MFLCPTNIDKLVIRGSFGAKNFDYIKIAVEGCLLGDQCISDEELLEKTINFVTVSSVPELLGSDPDNVVTYRSDETYFKYIDPQITQHSNIFVMKSNVRLQDKTFDIFD